MTSNVWAFAIAAFLTLSACGAPDAGEQQGTKLPAGERLTLSLTDIADMKAVGAEVTTRDSAEADRARAEGDSVQKGQQIGMIVDSRLGYETSALGSQVVAARAEADRARAELDRVRDLYENRVYAKARLDQAVAAARAADAQLGAARAQQGASASVAGQGAILAPATGRVLRADIPAGSVVAAGMSVATVTAGPPILRLDLPESLAGQVLAGAQVHVTAGDLPERSRHGQVMQVYPAITGGRIRADATVPGLTAELVGRRIGVSIEVGRRSAFVAPRRFVSTRYGIDQVDIITADRRLASVPVQIAPTVDSDKIEILSGVAAGDILFAPSVRR
jgi:RND family efflux transporter MFP subunit